MLESYNTRNPMQYHKLTAEEQKKRGILGRLVGVIADFVNPTRNGRKYTEELWDKTFNNPIMKEKLENRCCLGELGHPEDRQEILDPRKTETALAAPKVGKQDAETDALAYYRGIGGTPDSHPQRADKQKVKTGIDYKGGQHCCCNTLRIAVAVHKQA